MASLAKPHLKLIDGEWFVFSHRSMEWPSYSHSWFSLAANYARLMWKSEQYL